MKIERLPEPIDALVIAETFNENHLSNIKGEIRVLNKHDDGSGVWLTDVYRSLDLSSIHLNTMEAFFGSNVTDALVSINSMYGLYHHVNNHSTVIRSLGDGSRSPLRHDAAAFTIMTFIFDEPKAFTGGNVTLQVGAESAYEKDIENNMSIIFPSSYYVGLSDVSVEEPVDSQSVLSVIISYLFIESR